MYAGGRDLLRLPQRPQPEAARHRATTCACTATCRSTTTRWATITTSLAPTRRCAGTATCARRPTWWSIRATTTRCACRAWTTRSPTASRTRAPRPATKKNLAWANDAVVKWYGPVRTRGNDYVSALSRRRTGRPTPNVCCARRSSTGLRADRPRDRARRPGGAAEPGLDGRPLRRHRGRGRPRARHGARMLEQAPAADRWRLGA